MSEQPDDIFAWAIKELSDARADLFQYKIDVGIEKTIAIMQKIMPLAREMKKEKELNEISAALMGAMGQKDYLLFSDIAFYEIPALFDGCFLAKRNIENCEG
jgi:hypothetical protein